MTKRLAGGQAHRATEPTTNDFTSKQGHVEKNPTKYGEDDGNYHGNVYLYIHKYTYISI